MLCLYIIYISYVLENTKFDVLCGFAAYLILGRVLLGLSPKILKIFLGVPSRSVTRPGVVINETKLVIRQDYVRQEFFKHKL